MDIAGNNGGHKSAKTSKDGQIILPLLIEVPQIPIEELNEATDNFGPKSLIGDWRGFLWSGELLYLLGF